MPKVLHLGWSFSSHVTRWVYGLQKRGWETALLSYGGDALPDIETYIIERKKTGKLGYLQAIPHMRQVVATVKPDIIHAHYAAGFGLWGAFSGIRPLVISCWGTDVVSSAQTLLSGSLIRWSLKQADQTLTTSHFLKEVVEGLSLNLTTPPKVIPFGIDLQKLRSKTSSARISSAKIFSAKISSARISDNSADKRVRLLFFKGHKSIYGPKELLYAFASIADRFQNATLTMAGAGPLTDDLKQLTKTLKLEHRVSFPGFIDNKHALSYISGHDIMVMPSLVAEGFGVSALEALAVGLPVVASNTGGVSEIVADNQSGFLVNPENTEELASALAKLISDRQLREEFGAHGQQQVAKLYDWKNNLDDMETVYRELLR